MIRSVTVPIYDISLIFTNDTDEANKLRDKYRTIIEKYLDAKKGHDALDPEISNFVGHVEQAGGHVIMCVTDPGSVVHEAVHAAWEICDYADILCHNKNQEPMAYLVQWIHDEWQRRMT